MVYWIIGSVVGVGIISVFYYNRFVTLGNRIDNSLSQINVQLKRRAGLIPSLVESVKGFARHEKGIMKEVSQARAALVSAKGIENKMKANNALEGALGRLFAIAENYPDLKANTNFLELQRELSSTEDRVAYARQNYNDSILRYNVLCEKFPGVLFAGLFGKKKRKYIHLEKSEEKKPEVKFD